MSCIFFEKVGKEVPGVSKTGGLKLDVSGGLGIAPKTVKFSVSSLRVYFFCLFVTGTASNGMPKGEFLRNQFAYIL